ncbi:MAG: hypothetical protein HUJ90_00760 [Bacteroidales bacterium]|nr:hypothetical protein [Bacteroidales bacterium]
MKKSFVLLILSLLLLSGCTSKEEQVSKRVSEFLTAFFNMDYQKAFSYCAGDLAEELSEIGLEEPLADDEIDSIVKEASLNTTFEIVSVDTESAKGSAIVMYKIFPYGGGAPIEREMLLTLQGKEWVIVNLQ